MNKNIITNLVALIITIVGYFSPVYSEIIFTTGLFAISGGITNWLAIHMLFEKVPLLYGSGVIESRFEDFKLGIKNLIIKEFFSKEHIERFLCDNEQLSSDSITKKIDFDKVFEGLKDAISESQLGSMLGMFGGKEALNPLKEPVINKLKEIISELASNQDSKLISGDISESLIAKIENIIDKRLNELTPKMVKTIIQDMIRKHLGWLVVWGGVFGGLIGLVVGII